MVGLKPILTKKKKKQRDRERDRNCCLNLVFPTIVEMRIVMIIIRNMES